MSDDVDWSQYPISISFDAPCQVIGRLVGVRTVKAASGTPVPELTLRLDDGTTAVLVASQARLRRALHDAHPRLGDRIRIDYLGAEDKAAPGMHPSKKFVVKVAPKEAAK